MERQCFAYSNKGVRCMKEAGHDDLHAIIATWSDDECYTPGQMPEVNAPKPPLAAPIPADTCVACSHKHKGGECKCGCYEFIA